MVLYSIIKPYNSFFVINRNIARQGFVLNDLFCDGRNPGKILKFTSQTLSTSLAMTSHKHKQKVAQKFYTRKQNAYINLYTELVQVSMILNGSAHVLFEFEKNNKQSLKIDPSTQKKTWNVKCNKTITALQPWSILLSSAP
jgi:hypothetical protein